MLQLMLDWFFTTFTRIRSPHSLKRRAPLTRFDPDNPDFTATSAFFSISRLRRFSDAPMKIDDRLISFCEGD
jgi:hypothetical protein